jgi:GntR family transcriptional regulator, carbon starvation induced regulator
MNAPTRPRGTSLPDEIRADILRARFAPGEKLRLKMLSDHYGCGGSPIREALSHLAAEGWVIRIDNRGFQVSAMSRQEFDDILMNRCLLEEAALRRSIERGGEDWEERIIVCHFRLAKLDRVTASGVINPSWETAHRQFHMSLIAACDSPILLASCGRLYDLNIRYRHFSGRIAYPRRQVADEHSKIKDLVLARDTEGAVERLLRHYTDTGRFLFDDEDAAQEARVAAPQQGG